MGQPLPETLSGAGLALPASWQARLAHGDVDLAGDFKWAI